MKGGDAEEDPLLEELPTKGYKFLMDSALGGRFRRHIESLSKKQQKQWGDKSAAQKKAFKKEWAIEKYKEYQAERSHTVSETNSRKEWAELANFDVIVDREGGAHSPAAVQGAYNYCLKALSIG
eukprot:2469519-Pyramimonas_sp.AAC.1